MNYKNANEVIPQHLLIEIQKYVQGETIYIPKQPQTRKKWGSKSGSRAAIDERNVQIRQAFSNGDSIEQLAKCYFLSVETIKKIVYVKNQAT
jgi:Mor family transcriptional regulator